MRWTNLWVLALGLGLAAPAWAQKDDKDKKIAQANGWIYESFTDGLAKAKSTGKPLMVVIRCPP